MNVLLMIDRLSMGGASVVTVTLAKALRDAGCGVTILTLDATCELSVPEGVRHISVPFRPKGLMQKFTRFKRHALLLDEALETHGLTSPDLAVANLYKTQMVVARSRFLAHKAWFCIHTSPCQEHLEGRSALGRALRKRRLRTLYSHLVLGVSRGIRDEVIERIGARPERAEFIHNPFDLERIRALKDEPLDQDYGDFFVHVGRLDLRQKRQDRLIEWFAASGLPDKLLLVGRGGDEAAIREKIQALGLADRVLLVGKQANPYKFMGRAKALLLTSDYEGFGLVIVEALACGTPVVSTNCPVGPDEILVGELTVDLVKMQDRDGFIERLRHYSSHPARIPPAYVERFHMRNVGEAYRRLAS